MSGRLTEEGLTKSFKRAVLGAGSATWRFNGRPISYLLTEFSARDGSADIVLVPSRMSNSQLDWADMIGKGVRTPAAASVLAHFPRAASVNEDTLVQRTGLSGSTVHRIVRRLECSGLVRKVSPARYQLEPLRGEGGVEFWAYEMKLSDWAQALYQASQYRVFAHNVSVVLAEEYGHRVRPNLGQFRRFNVGVLTINPRSGNFRVLVKTRRSNPQSRSHYLYAVSELARRIQRARQRRSKVQFKGGAVKRPPAETIPNPKAILVHRGARSSAVAARRHSS